MHSQSITFYPFLFAIRLDLAKSYIEVCLACLACAIVTTKQHLPPTPCIQKAQAWQRQRYAGENLVDMTAQRFFVCPTKCAGESLVDMTAQRFFVCPTKCSLVHCHVVEQTTTLLTLYTPFHAQKCLPPCPWSGKPHHQLCGACNNNWTISCVSTQSLHCKSVRRRSNDFDIATNFAPACRLPRWTFRVEEARALTMSLHETMQVGRLGSAFGEGYHWWQKIEKLNF